jgi:hypothetical protein
MTFFYIGNDNEKDIRRCHESRDRQDPITVTGLTIDGRSKILQVSSKRSISTRSVPTASSGA